MTNGTTGGRPDGSTDGDPVGDPAGRRPWWDRLNRRLFPYIGPPPLGPYGEAPLPSTGPKPCPICGHPMSEHEIERRDGRPTQVHCPVQVA